MGTIRLLLEVVSYAGNPPDAPLSMTLDQESATIGRRAGNRWVLPDPLRYISGQHATIEYRTPDYYLADTSTNGIEINGTRLGKGGSQKLIEGDRLTMGEYLISVALIQQQTDDLPDVPAKTPVGDAESDELFPDWDEDIGMQGAAAGERTPSDYPTFEGEQVPIVGSDLDNNPVSPLEEPFAANFPPPPDQPDSKEPVTDPFPDWGDSPEPEKPTPEVKEKKIQTDAGEKKIEAPRVKPAHTDWAQSFLQGAGLTDEAVAHPLTPESFYAIGAMLRISVQGMMDVLAVRASIKNEMRLDVTVMRSTRNNPIKFSCNTEDVMATLLSASGDGYMPPQQAIEEAFDDIKAHQLAVLAGMQTALKSVLKRFNPDKLEQRLQKQSPVSASIPIHKQAKLWSLFEQLYDDIEHEAEDDFNRLFGQAFAQAYEKQVDQLQQAKKESSI